MKRAQPTVLPQGPLHYWRQMVALSRTGGFTITDIHGRTNGRSLKTIKDYIRFCLQDGHVIAIGERSAIKNITAKVYRVRDARSPAPIQRRASFCDKRGRGAQQMWNTMRNRRIFTARDIAIHASTDVIPVQEKAAREYIGFLVKAGYVEPESKRPDGRIVWKLMPAFARGPIAPAVMQRKSVLYDRNLDRTVNLNQAAAAEVAA